MRVRVVVYRGEIYYTAHLKGWQGMLVARLTPRYQDRRLDPRGPHFASDDEARAWWHELDSKAFAAHVDLDVDSDTTVQELIDQVSPQTLFGQDPFASPEGSDDATRRADLAKSFGFPTDPIVTQVVHLESGRMLAVERSLGGQGVEADDLIAVIVGWPPNALYSLAALPTSDAVFAALRSDGRHLPPDTVDGFASIDRVWTLPQSEPVLGVLLYTDEDEELATYVRAHLGSLSELSDPYFRLFVIEESESDWRGASRYWRDRLDVRLNRIWTTLGWLKTKPYNRAQAYALAMDLGIGKDQIPCLALIQQGTDERLVFPILEVSPEFFRRLFATLDDLAGSTRCRSGEHFRRLRDDYAAIIERVSTGGTPEADTTVNHNFFHGQTVYVNRPAGPVALSNFQNRTEGPTE